MTYNTRQLRNWELVKQVESYRPLFRPDFELALKTALANEGLFDKIMPMKVNTALLAH